MKLNFAKRFSFSCFSSFLKGVIPSYYPYYYI